MYIKKALLPLIETRTFAFEQNDGSISDSTIVDHTVFHDVEVFVSQYEAIKN